VPTQPLSQWVPGVKRPGHKADYSPPTSVEVKNRWAYSLHKHRDTLTLHLEHCSFSIDWGPFKMSNVSKTVSEIVLILNITETSDYAQHSVRVYNERRGHSHDSHEAFENRHR
jgi:hypothetical protein